MSNYNLISYKLYSIYQKDEPWGNVYTIRHPSELIKEGFTSDEVIGLLYCNETIRGWTCDETDIDMRGTDNES